MGGKEKKGKETVILYLVNPLGKLLLLVKPSLAFCLNWKPSGSSNDNYYILNYLGLTLTFRYLQLWLKQ